MLPCGVSFPEQLPVGHGSPEYALRSAGVQVGDRTPWRVRMSGKPQPGDGRGCVGVAAVGVVAAKKMVTKASSWTHILILILRTTVPTSSDRIYLPTTYTTNCPDSSVDRNSWCVLGSSAMVSPEAESTLSITEYLSGPS